MWETTLPHPCADSARCRQVSTTTDSVHGIFIMTLDDLDDHYLRDAVIMISGFSRVVLCLPFHTPSRYQFNRQSLLLVYGLFSNYAEGCLLDRARFACISPQLSWRSCVKYFRKTQNVTPQPWIQPHNWKHLSTNGSAFIRGYM